MQYEAEPPEIIRKMVADNPVVIFSESTCCMCLTVKRLFSGMGVNAEVYELDEEPDRKELKKALMRMELGAYSAVPAVFVDDQLVGSVDRVMASNMSGTLVPLLKEAGALCLFGSNACDISV